MAAVEVQTLAVHKPLLIREEVSTTGKAVLEAARTKAGVAVTKQVAVPGVVDDDNALRMGAGR